MLPVSYLPINEVFETVQGEASFTGTPSIFVRLQGCPVGCPWCDTKHTWEVDPTNEVSFALVAGKTKDSPTYANVPASELIEFVVPKRSRHVVLTGGEPCLYDLWSLTRGLIAKGKTVQIETSGTHKVVVSDEAFVTVSPKIDMPGNFVICDQAIERADEIKIPVGKLADIKRAEFICARVPDTPIWLQPLSQSQKATDLCIAVAAERGWHVSIQMHKVAGVR